MAYRCVGQGRGKGTSVNEEGEREEEGGGGRITYSEKLSASCFISVLTLLSSLPI